MTWYVTNIYQGMPCCPAGCDMMWQDWQGRVDMWQIAASSWLGRGRGDRGLNMGVFGVQNQNQYLIHIFGQFCFLLAISIFLNSPIDINIYQKFLLDINIFVTLNFLNTDIPNTPSWKVDKEGGTGQYCSDHPNGFLALASRNALWRLSKGDLKGLCNH